MGTTPRSMMPTPTPTPTTRTGTLADADAGGVADVVGARVATAPRTGPETTLRTA
jgi:hypothetical protein